mmetsp:Transcript_64001/g.157456  ORF Transcript_64001/g.157456 Transcript_64001/m.157456 type:complete len:249 (-) Transcript_64001:156-902(-)
MVPSLPSGTAPTLLAATFAGSESKYFDPDAACISFCLSHSFPGPMSAGERALTLILWGARSFAAVRVMPITAALDATYATMVGVPLSAATDAVLTMVPPPVAFMLLATACMTMNAPVTLTRITVSKSSTGYSSRGCIAPCTPALLNRASICPKRSSAALTAALTDATSVTSAFIATVSDPPPPLSELSSSTIRLVSFRGSSAASTKKSFAPCLHNATEAQRPMSPPAPVMKTVLPPRPLSPSNSATLA